MNLRKEYLPFVLALFGLMAGCTRTLYVPTRPGWVKLHEFNQQLAGKKANLVLAGSGQELSVENVHIAADDISYVDSKTGSVNRVSPTKVQKITVRDRSRGVLHGAKTGLIIWGSAAAVLFPAAIDWTANEDERYKSGFLVLALLGGASLPVGGALLGAAAGSKTVYVMGDKPNSKARRAGK